MSGSMDFDPRKATQVPTGNSNYTPPNTKMPRELPEATLNSTPRPEASDGPPSQR